MFTRTCVHSLPGKRDLKLKIANKLVFIFYDLMVAIASLQPPGQMPSVSYAKVAHFITYGVFAFLAYRLRLTASRYIYACIGIVLYSGLLEIGQSLIPGRDMSALDLLANTLGVTLGAVLCDKIHDYSNKTT